VAELTILAPRLIGNTDGIDLDSCVNVTMVDSLVDVGDDGICIKAGIDQTNTRVATDGVLVERCRIWSRNFAIGSDVSGWVRNVMVRNSIISSPQGSAPWAIKIKGHQTNGGGVENVSFVNLTVGPIGPTPQQPHSSVFLDVYMNYGSSASPCANPHSIAPDSHMCVDGAWRYRPASLAGSPPTFRNIIFDNVTVASANDAGSIEGLPNSNVTGLSFRNVAIKKYEKSWSCHYVNNTFTDHVSPSWGCN
jgi:polygalacturonase